MNKTINKIIALLASIIALAACNTLDQRSDSDYDDATVFSNPTLARYFVNNIYESYVVTSSYHSEYTYYYGTNTDVEILDYGRGERPDIGKYIVELNNRYYNNSSTAYLFSGNFMGIERANLAIQGFKKYGDIENNHELGALYGEALTVRSLLYIDLMNNFGEVPARFEPVNETTCYLPKEDKDVLYKHILADLEEAAHYMDYDDMTETTRAGKACALAMYARVALQAAGYSLRPDEGKVNTGDPGTIRKSNDPALSPSAIYPKALAACKDIIDSHKFALESDFEQIWKDCCNQNNVTPGKETIYALPFSSQRGTQLTYNAVPNEKYNQGGGGGYKRLCPSLFFCYDPDDLRRDITCCLQTYDAAGKSKATSMRIAKWYCGKFRWEYAPDHPLSGRLAPDGCKMVWIRLADVYLMAAELANELGDLNAAKEYMRPVLERAYGDKEKAQAYLDKQVDSEIFQQAVKDQRAFEFAGENLRKTDLIRWGELKSAMDEAAVLMQEIKTRTGRFNGWQNNIYYRYKADGLNLEIYGLNPGEKDNKTVTDPSGNWTEFKNFYSGMAAEAYTLLYVNNPDEKMYRPIPEQIITANQGYIVNDYGY